MDWQNVVGAEQAWLTTLTTPLPPGYDYGYPIPDGVTVYEPRDKAQAFVAAATELQDYITGQGSDVNSVIGVRGRFRLALYTELYLRLEGAHLFKCSPGAHGGGAPQDLQECRDDLDALKRTASLLGKPAERYDECRISRAVGAARWASGRLSAVLLTAINVTSNGIIDVSGPFNAVKDGRGDRGGVARAKSARAREVIRLLEADVKQP
jgi:hypothetical protein